MTPDDPRHGTYAGFHCHRYADEPICDACRQAKADYERAARARRLASGAFSHGTRSGFDNGCRCAKCRSAQNKRYADRRRERQQSRLAQAG